MRYRIVVTTLVVVCGLMLGNAKLSAQAPSAFDGKYLGTATQLAARGNPNCAVIKSMDMTITGGRVIVHENDATGGRDTYRGGVDASGQVSTTHVGKNDTYDSASSSFFVNGAISNNVFTGQRTHDRCIYSVSMAKQ